MTLVIGPVRVGIYARREEDHTMSHACSCGGATASLDVRDVAPRTRHPKIFETFDALRPGHAFVLLNDHDPRPLYYQFQAERPGTFGWRYLEQGPEVWRVEISKPLARFTADQTVEQASRAPGALAELQRLGINHCCGAHMTLAEAAAAAGVPVDTLLRALNDTVAARA